MIDAFELTEVVRLDRGRRDFQSGKIAILLSHGDEGSSNIFLDLARLRVLELLNLGREGEIMHGSRLFQKIKHARGRVGGENRMGCWTSSCRGTS